MSWDEDRVDYRLVIDQALDAMVGYSLEQKVACKVIARNLSVAGLSEEAMEADRPSRNLNRPGISGGSRV